jgi:UDP-2-acetamido-2,6-beta-L-arabino-hexul-4-ose reductase
MNNRSVYQEGERGWALFPFGSEGIYSEDITDIHLVSIEPGHVRGNHYHLNKEEHLFIFGGKSIVATCRSEDPGDKQEVDVNGETPFYLKIDEGVAHAIKNKGKFPVYLFCYSRPLKKDQKAATVSMQVL